MSEFKNSRNPHNAKPVEAVLVPKSKKPKNFAPIAERTHFDIFSRAGGYVCTCQNEDKLNETLRSLFKDLDRGTRRARSEGKKTKRFDCYGIARTGFNERVIELYIAEDDESERDTYEDAVERENS